MNQSQRKNLTERIDQAYRRHSYGARDKKQNPEPAAVAKARQLLEEYQAEVRILEDNRMSKIRAARIETEEAVLFGDTDAALKAVKKFEAMKFKA